MGLQGNVFMTGIRSYHMQTDPFADNPKERPFCTRAAVPSGGFSEHPRADLLVPEFDGYRIFYADGGDLDAVPTFVWTLRSFDSYDENEHLRVQNVKMLMDPNVSTILRNVFKARGDHLLRMVPPPRLLWGPEETARRIADEMRKQMEVPPTSDTPVKYRDIMFRVMSQQEVDDSGVAFVPVDIKFKPVHELIIALSDGRGARSFLLNVAANQFIREQTIPGSSRYDPEFANRYENSDVLERNSNVFLRSLFAHMMEIQTNTRNVPDQIIGVARRQVLGGSEGQERNRFILSVYFHGW